MYQQRFSCPHCQSENIQNLSLLYANGLSRANLDIPSAFNANMINQTLLSDLCSPPQEPVYSLPEEFASETAKSVSKVGCLFMFALIASFFVGVLCSAAVRGPGLVEFLCGWVVSFGLLYYVFVQKEIEARAEARERAIALAQQKYEADQMEYERQLALWRTQYVCLRCGSSFYIR